MRTKDGWIALCCTSRKHADVEAGLRGTARVQCRERHCRREPNEIVVHYFDLATGELIETRRYARVRVIQDVGTVARESAGR